MDLYTLYKGKNIFDTSNTVDEIQYEFQVNFIKKHVKERCMLGYDDLLVIVSCAKCDTIGHWAKPVGNKLGDKRICLRCHDIDTW